ncbi:UDP-glucose/GDP-mannose dehydrogenase family protein [Candidatus Parcubacteria bacterium]|nr:UDP-glucose/GDP-mannose dehydrogenase family protein [Candidatus Parcubacteria bacterium]
MKQKEIVDLNNSNNTPAVSIVGVGYVGLTLAAILSNAGIKTYAVDIDKDKIDIIKKGKSYFFEPGLNEFVKEGIESKKLIPTTNYKAAIENSDITFICVGTPSNPDGSVNLDFVFKSVKSILENIKSDLIIVQKSTVPVGTGKRIKKMIDKYNSKDININLISSPEFLREGSAVFDTIFPDRIIVGGNSKKAIKKVVALYEKIDNFAKNVKQNDFMEYALLYTNRKRNEDLASFFKRVIETDLESSELIKVTANSFLALKISFANSVSRLCAQNRAKTADVMVGIGSDHRIGKSFLTPGLGYGGGCFPKDVAGMINYANSYNFSFNILDEAVKINETQVYFAISKIKKLLGEDLRNKKAAFLGLSYKPGTSDVRKSQASRLLRKILDRGMAVFVYDPQAISEAKKKISHKNLTYIDNIKDVFKKADIIILATEWNEFVDFDYSKITKDMNSLNFFDGRGVIDEDKIKELGFNFIGF